MQSKFQNLTWTLLTKVFRVEDPVDIRWYLNEASREMRSGRALDRNIRSQYHERHYQQPSGMNLLDE
ncbi:MAG: hypothetical protein IJ268_02120 [Proteobacteria bacterium]|nr:hypothetical protein [Pseudomonadota bacterium]